MAARGAFSSRIGFIAAAAGSAVGLGNIWMFPFEVGQGGGAAFVAIYLFFAFVLCFPVMVAEIAMGRSTQKNIVGAYSKLGSKGWGRVGFLGVIAGVLILSFYNIVAGWTFGYFIEIAMGRFEIGKNFGVFTKDILKVGSYALFFMITTAYIVSHGISAGIEKTSKILMPTLIVMMVFLVIYALTLPNAMEGLKFYMLPDFSAITPKVVYGAMGQAFFSLSLGVGGLLTYGSYLSKKENIVTSAAFITLADVGVALLAGLMMFPFVFYQNLEPSGGPGLIFVTLPGIFQTLGPNLGVLIGCTFFLLLSFAALTSTVSILEIPVAYTVDEFKIKRKTAVWLVSSIIFLIGIPSLLSSGASSFFTNFITYFNSETPTDFMTFVGDIASNTIMPIGGFTVVIMAAYVWKKKNFHKEVAIGFPGYNDSFIKKYIDFIISYLAPVLLFVIFIITVLDMYFGITFF